MFNFIPDERKLESSIPYLEDCQVSDGWGGQTTTKKAADLIAEITAALYRLGAETTAVIRGKYADRIGMQIRFNITDLTGQILSGRLDICALPIKPKNRIRYRTGSMQSDDKRNEQSLCMALFNVRNSLQALWRLQFLTPGYSALMPWMLTDNDQTIGQVWMNRQSLPAPADNPNSFEKINSQEV